MRYPPTGYIMSNLKKLDFYGVNAINFNINFCFFHYTKKPSFFITDFEGTYEVLLRHKYFWSAHLYMTAFLIFFFLIWTVNWNLFLWFFKKWKKYYYNLTFDDTLKMYCCALCWSKSKLNKQTLFKSRAAEYAISFFCDFLLTFIFMRLYNRHKGVAKTS